MGEGRGGSLGEGREGLRAPLDLYETGGREGLLVDGPSCAREPAGC